MGEAQEVPFSKGYRSVAALIRRPKATQINSTTSIYSGEFLENVQPLCSSEPYRDQTVIADCSSFLVTEDTMVTAGHCIVDQKDCSEMAVAFDFEYQAGSVPSGINFVPEFRVEPKNQYKCKNLLYKSDSEFSKSKSKLNFQGRTPDSLRRYLGYDIAIFRLDRAVSDRGPLKFSSSNNILKRNEDVVAFGFPNGVPKKYATGHLSQTDFPYLISQITISNGFSGSPLLNRNDEVLGMIFLGNNDFSWRDGGGIRPPCLETKICDEKNCELPGEIALDSRVITALLKTLNIQSQSKFISK